jgi:hypothetical protein
MQRVPFVFVVDMSLYCYASYAANLPLIIELKFET